MSAPSKYRLYRLLLGLYPKPYREQYGEQMVQTLDDWLHDSESGASKLTIWLRVIGDLPVSVIQEHIVTMEGKTMKETTKNSKTIILVAATLLVATAFGGIAWLMAHQSFHPTTLSNVQSRAPKQTCLLAQDDPAVKIPEPALTDLSYAVMSSIIDVPAGTNVDIHFKSFTGTQATGTSVYQGTYGSYNFAAEKKPAGWIITSFDPCK